MGKKQTFLLSRLMHSARLKWTNSHLIELVRMLGERNDWRKAMEVVHWVHCREYFGHRPSRCYFLSLQPFSFRFFGACVYSPVSFHSITRLVELCSRAGEYLGLFFRISMMFQPRSMNVEYDIY